MDYKELIEELRFLSRHVPEDLCDDDGEDALEKAATAIESLLAEQEEIRMRMTRDALVAFNNNHLGLLRIGTVQEWNVIQNWIRVTPETMPPDMEPILITVEPWNRRGFSGRYVPRTQARYSKSRNSYEVYQSDGFASGWSGSELAGDKITHWMPYPEPAED